MIAPVQGGCVLEISHGGMACRECSTTKTLERWCTSLAAEKQGVQMECECVVVVVLVVEVVVMVVVVTRFKVRHESGQSALPFGNHTWRIAFCLSLVSFVSTSCLASSACCSSSDFFLLSLLLFFLVPFLSSGHLHPTIRISWRS